MGLAYGEKSNYDKAIECYQKVIELKPDYVDAAYFNMGKAYQHLNNQDKANEYFEKASIISNNEQKYRRF
jgi:tetratricopeptide (TPR) repeat protein